MNRITPSNILVHELIGLKATIAECTNRQLIGVEGVIIDETKNTIIILDDRRRRIPKDIAVFRIQIPNGTVVEVDGKMLVGRPEDRLKMKVRRWRAGI